ncbi:VAN3-binding protein-like isoform X2 [Canna indica]|uniref:VAN3-binding protein-like isoform X2 n=1 Tax=Canna indica TaxID=4628 RepID=A0AAQ3KEJ3_9LILI|nr:VAN3-binding protein-like isoform X2 [Canna indica]
MQQRSTNSNLKVLNKKREETKQRKAQIGIELKQIAHREEEIRICFEPRKKMIALTKPRASRLPDPTRTQLRSKVQNQPTTIKLAQLPSFHVIMPISLGIKRSTDYCIACTSYSIETIYYSAMHKTPRRMHASGKEIIRAIPSRRTSSYFDFDMEEFGSHDRLGRVSFSRHPSLCYMDDRIQAISQNKALELYKDQAKLMTCYCPLEVPKSPNQAMEFLSRTWSPSSTNFFQILSSNNLSSTLQDHHSEELDEQVIEKNKNNFSRDTGRKMDQILTMLSSVNLVQSKSHRHKDLQGGWVKAWLGGETLSSLSRGWKRKKRKEDLRLQTAQIHAALSVARLAAGIAGILGNFYLEPIKSNVVALDTLEGELDRKMNTVVRSAAALIATVCAEAAESVGANRGQVSSIVQAGLATRTSADLLTLTATTATCLRGAAMLELRAATCRHLSQDHNILEKGAQLPIQMPEGKVQLRMVKIYHKHDKVTLRLGKKHMRGVINIYNEYRIYDVANDPKECGFLKNDHGCYLVTLGTSGGAIQLQFQDQKQYVLWKSSISKYLSDCQKPMKKF